MVCSTVIIAGPGAQAAASPTTDVAIGLTADPAGIFTHTVTWTVTVTNNGPEALRQAIVGSNVIFGDPPPVSVVLPPECTRGFFDIRCTVGSVPPGARLRLPIKASATGLGGAGDEGPITFRLLGSTPVDPNPSNNSATITCLIGGSLFLRC